MSVRSALLTVAAVVLFGASALAADAKRSAGLARLAEAPPGTPIEVSDDPAVASFQRMLTHEPNWAAPAIPESFEKDPLFEALALPMLRWSVELRHRRCRQALRAIQRSRLRGESTELPEEGVGTHPA